MTKSTDQEMCRKLLFYCTYDCEKTGKWTAVQLREFMASIFEKDVIEHARMNPFSCMGGL